MRTETLRLSWHIVVRNWTVYRKDFFANISPTIADPALIMISLGFGLGSYLSNVEGRSYMAFMAPGMVAATALFTSFFETSYGFYVRLIYENVFKAMLTTPIGPREIVLGEYFWNFIKALIMGTGVSIVLYVLGLMPHLWYVLPAALIAGLTAMPCAALGLLACSFVRNINQFQTVYSYLIAPIYFLSGIFFPVESLPQSVKVLMNVSPFYHGVRLLQLLFWEQLTTHDVLVHGSVLILFSLVLGIWSAQRIRPKLVS